VVLCWGRPKEGGGDGTLPQLGGQQPLCKGCSSSPVYPQPCPAPSPPRTRTEGARASGAHPRCTCGSAPCTRTRRTAARVGAAAPPWSAPPACSARR
jgi:hypothetical protein